MKVAILVFSLCAVSLVGGVVHPVDYTRTPSGWVLSHCQHTVPRGSHLVTVADGSTHVFGHGTDVGVTQVIPKCDSKGYPVLISGHVNDTQKYLSQRKQRMQPQQQQQQQLQDSPLPADYDGWLAYTEYMDAQGFSSFLGNFSVPQAIPGDVDIEYYFTGLQNIDWIPKHDPEPSTPFDIIQPVLQFPSDFGFGWSVKSWLVTLQAGAIATTEITCNPGDVIFGNMTLVGPSTLYVGSTVDGQTTDFTHTDATRLRLQPWAYTTLECYGCDACTSFPADNSTFSAMKLYKENKPLGAIPWKITPKKPLATFCNERVSVTEPDGSGVIYEFQK